jgi:hypothetical protein
VAYGDRQGHGDNGRSTRAGVRLSRDVTVAGGEGLVGRGTGVRTTSPGGMAG